MAGTETLGGLLAATRQALATLRADELEALAERAEGMLAAMRTQSAPIFAQDGNSKNTQGERRLLGDLLEATGRNLAVVRRVRGGMRAGEENRRWEL